MAQSKYPYYEFSGALQEKSTTHIRKPNEVRVAKNADFASVLGAMRRRKGAQSTVAEMPKLPADTPALGGYIARFNAGPEIWAAQDDDDASPTESALLRYTGPAPDDWVEVSGGHPVGSEFNMTDDLDEVWVSTYDSILDTIGASFTVDSSHNISTTRQLAYGPDARFFIEYDGSMWAADVLIDGERFRDRIYKSSGPTGAISFVRAPQTDPYADFTLVNQVPVMSAASTPAGTAAASTTQGSNDPWKAFDGSSVTKWLANATTGNLSYDLGSGNAKVITHYAIRAVQSDEFGEVDRAPATWTFEGSNNGSSWTTLDTQTTVPAWTAGERREYVTTNTTSYRYYRINISANKGDGSYVGIAEAEFLSSATNVDVLQLDVDSVRYLKVGMIVEIYAAGTETLLYTVQITAVDKINDTIQFIPASQNFGTGDVNTSTEVITLPDATGLPTGTPIIFASSGAVPTGLTAGVTYYSIYVSSTTIKVATSALNASLGVAVNITATGSGTHRVRASYVFGNKDEIWKQGRKGMLTRFWNVDYRNPEASDYLKLRATADGANAITAIGAISNRMFVWTITAMHRYDGQTLLPLRNDVGCVAHRSIGYYDSFMCWLDNKGNIWIRNEEAGQQDIISESIRKTMELIPQEQLPEAVAVCVDDTYKLSLGQVDGVTIRVCYNFRTNQWTTERWTPQMPIALEYTYDQNIKPHFFDETGQMWVDEEGTDDNGEAIHMEVETGNDNFGVEEVKKLIGIKVYSKAAAGTKIFVIVDDGDPIEVGQVVKGVDSIAFPNNTPRGTMINIRFTSSFTGETPQIDKATVWYNKEEDTFRASQ